MRFLIVDHFYARFIDDWYARHPGLVQLSYEEQRASLRSSLVGETAFQAAALRDLGHEAVDVIVNVWPAQAAWAREHLHRVSADPRWELRLRRGIVPWPVLRPDSRWMGEVLLRQIDAFRPDVVHVSSMDLLAPALIREIRSRCRCVVGQIAARLATERALAGYDLIVSSLPNFVDRFRSAGAEAEWLPLAFEPSVLEAVGPRELKVPVTFVGSLFDVHRARARTIEAIGARKLIEVWTADQSMLRVSPGGRIRIHPAVWGIEMYRVLASSRLTVNVHGRTEDVAPMDANNLRLYEATGMGALLVTDRMRNLGQLFEVGREVVDYADPNECAEVVAYYLEHPTEASTIAQAGQARTLRDHTWRDRMAREVEFVSQML